MYCFCQNADSLRLFMSHSRRTSLQKSAYGNAVIVQCLLLYCCVRYMILSNKRHAKHGMVVFQNNLSSQFNFRLHRVVSTITFNDLRVCEDERSLPHNV